MRILKLIVVALIIFTSCNTASKDIETQISDLVKELKSSESLDLEKVSQLVDLYEKFIVENPSSEKTPKYMEMKAKYLTALNKYQEAVDEYEKIYSQFPNYEKRSEALFMQAFIYEVNLNNLVKAEEYYQKYLQEFPDGDLADDARFSLDNLYLSPEQLLEMFRQKSMEDSADSL